MEKLPTDYTKYYPMLRVYKDDLEQIVAIVKENCDDITIEADGYKLSDIADLDQLQEREHLATLAKFKVSGSMKPANSPKWIFLRVQLEQGYKPRVSLSDASNTKLYGAAMQIDAILSARVSKLDAITSAQVIIVSELICIGGFVFVGRQPWELRLLHPSSEGVAWSVAMLGFALLAFLALPYTQWLIRGKYYVIVYLTDSHSHKRLTREQRKRLMDGGIGFSLGILGTVIGGLIVWALTR